VPTGVAVVFAAALVESHSPLPGDRSLALFPLLQFGFASISSRSYLLGVVESRGHGWYVVVVRVAMYNALSPRRPT